MPNDPMTLSEYARRVRTNYHTLYARVDRRINRGETNGLPREHMDCARQTDASVFTGHIPGKNPTAIHNHNGAGAGGGLDGGVLDAVQSDVAHFISFRWL